MDNQNNQSPQPAQSSGNGTPVQPSEQTTGNKVSLRPAQSSGRGVPFSRPPQNTTNRRSPPPPQNTTGNVPKSAQNTTGNVPPTSPSKSAAPGEVPSSASGGPAVQETKRWRLIPKDLYALDDGKVVQQVEYLRANCATIAPEEMHLRLNPEEIADVAETQFSDKARQWERRRNLLLFLPLICTWLSLGLASGAFKVSATDPQNAGQTFFALWINGFPSVSTLTFRLGPLAIPFPLTFLGGHWFSFGHVALLDVVLLAAVMLSNQQVHKAGSAAHKRTTELGSWLRSELEILSQKSLVHALSLGPDSKQPQWAVQVHTAIGHLQTVLENVQVAVKDSQKSFASTIDRFADSYQQQNMSIDNLIQNTRDIEVAITQLLTMKDIYIRLESILPDMGRHFEIMAQQEEKATSALAAIASEIANASQAIVAISQPFQSMGVQQIAQQVADQQRTNLEELVRMESRLREMNAGAAKMANPKGRRRFWRWRPLHKLFF